MDGDTGGPPAPPGFAGMTAGAFPELVPGASAPGPPDVVERLHRLSTLHAAGAMTDAEYVDLRAALLEGR